MASRVGNYLLFETLGEGAFGKVKLGVHEETGEQVAVKIMDKNDIRAQEMTMNVRREIAIMKALKHRNIVNLRQVLTSQSKLYIVMDLVTGGELFTKILKEGKLEERTARHYFQQLVDGIEYCHRRGVCHRDLKPENLLIDETTGELKITDFGLSAMKGASTSEELLHTQCGSPNYCAPEIIARHKQGYNGAKVDAWSCGIILFALLAGFLPFYDENTKVLYRMIQRDDVKFPKKFPPDAKDLVFRLLHKDPEKRYTLNDVKKHHWFLVDYTGVEAEPKSAVSASGSPQHRPARRKGHRRKPSMDQGPRSRDLADRKRSEKSDKSDKSDTAGPSSNPPVPPSPPPVIDAPLGHGRPPVPPPTTPVPASTPSSPPPAVPPPVIPLPHIGRPSVPPVPLPSSPKQKAKPAYQVPPYNPPPYPSHGRKKSVDRRPSRDTFPPIPDEPTREGQPVRVKAGVPPYPFPAPPPFPPAPAPPRSAPPLTVNVPNTPSSDGEDRGDGSSRSPLPSAEGGRQEVQENGMSCDVPDSLSKAAMGEGVEDFSNPTTPSAGATSPMKSGRKWPVDSTSRPANTYQTPVTPVSTPGVLAEGDSSWMKDPPRKVAEVIAEVPKPTRHVPKKVEKEEASEGAGGSIVGRLRDRYDQMAGPPPRPDPVIGSGNVRKDVSPLPNRFDDRGEIKMSPFPKAVEGSTKEVHSAGVTPHSSRTPEAGASASTSDMSLRDAFPHDKDASGNEDADHSKGPLPAELAIDEPVAGLKERLAAAVARYRRIFKLGANIGITASPSFTSNKGNNNIGDSNVDEDGKRGTSKSDFFAKAKGVTGAWGIILSQELEEDSDSEEERLPVTEAELVAFSRLLDFWDNRRASATASKGPEIILDDVGVSPLSEDDISNIQSLLTKLEPKAEDEDDVTEVEDVPTSTGQLATDLGDRDGPTAGIIEDGVNREEQPTSESTNEEGPVSDGKSSAKSHASEVEATYQETVAPRAVELSSISDTTSSLLSAPTPPALLGPSSSAAASGHTTSGQRGKQETQSVMLKKSVEASVENDGTGSNERITKDVPVATLNKTTSTGSSSKPAQDTLTKSGAAEEPKKPTHSRKSSVREDGDGASGSRLGSLSGREGVQSQPEKKDKTDIIVDSIIGGGKRKSSANTSEDHEGRLNNFRPAGRAPSSTSNGSGRPTRWTNRPPAADEHAWKGLFRFNVMGRRNSAMTTFETELMPDECLLEVGKILVAMGCEVMMKRGENKMKCVAHLRNETLRVSITCTREKKVSSVQFKKGKRDRSQVDAREFYDFFEVVRSRFLQRTGSEQH